jgi:hypothetical protein
MEWDVQIFKTKWFVRYVRQEHISVHGLRNAIERAERGLVDADLGGGVIKQRVARTGEGRSGGYRMLIAYRSGDRAVFMYGIAKNDRCNIDEDELATLQEIGTGWLAAQPEQLDRAIKEGLLEEMNDDDKSKYN